MPTTWKEQHNPAAVDALLQQKAHPLADAIALLRSTVLAADSRIGEHVKWNSPAYFYNAEMAPYDPKTYQRDMLVLNLAKPTHILLVFPSGAIIPDPDGILEGNYPDGRRMLTLRSTEEVAAKATALQGLLRAWIEKVGVLFT